MITLEFDFFPPSENHAYVTVRGSHRVLTKEGKKFKREFIELAWDLYEVDLDPLIDALGHHRWLKVSAKFFFPEEKVVNKGWLKISKGKRSAQQRYKKMDVHNYLKLLADALSDTTRIDDHRFQWGEITKWVDNADPRMVLHLEDVDPADYGVPEPYALQQQDDPVSRLR